MQSATYPSEFGYGVTQINVTTKSGTNQIRGSLFEYHRNDAFDAKNFFDSKIDPIPPFERNQFGGTVGGPVLRNKLFFFANYEGLREDKALTARSSVPLAALRAGNFAGRNPIYDPATRVQQPDGTITAQQFPNNQIPANRIDAKTRTAMQQFWPTANLPGTASNYLNTESRQANTDQWLGRVDFVQSDAISWYGRFNWAKDREYAPAAFPGLGTWTNSRPDQALVGNTWVRGADARQQRRASAGAASTTRWSARTPTPTTSTASCSRSRASTCRATRRSGACRPSASPATPASATGPTSTSRTTTSSRWPTI